MKSTQFTATRSATGVAASTSRRKDSQLLLLLAAVSLVSLLCVPPLMAAADKSPVVVASGKWQGHGWKLEVSDEPGGQLALHCYQVEVDFRFTNIAPPSNPNCGRVISLPPGAPASFPHGFAYTTLTVCPLAFIDGMTTSQANQVVITLDNGKTVHTPTIIPPHGLARDVRYFAVQLPCGSPPAKLVGISQSGKQVALVIR